ncbi:MAG: hypothetical protein FWC89_04980 [Defluviitaleaceae bacterium]|nr:hypothetical protein [Defluviitaleaceae bacterium]
MSKDEDNNKRFRISIPTADTAVLEWLKNQTNVSFSLRVLIKDAIAQDGYMDVTCRANPSMGKPRRAGRPPKKVAKKVTAYQGFAPDGDGIWQEHNGQAAQHDEGKPHE